MDFFSFFSWPRWQVWWGGISDRQRLALILACAALISLLIVGWWWRAPSYEMLVSKLKEKEQEEVLVLLQQMGVEYKLTDEGHTVLVPKERATELRLRLATLGYPKSSSASLEALRENKWGQSQFLEQINYQRVLEEDLARSIQSLDAVATARVHLAIPRQTGFLREGSHPSASVLLHVKNGHHLSTEQVAGIVNLVASSVPNLAANQVAVVDQNGQPLTEESAKPSTHQWARKQMLENSFLAHIHQLLNPLLGEENYRAVVNVDMAVVPPEAVRQVVRKTGKSKSTPIPTPIDASAAGDSESPPSSIETIHRLSVAVVVDSPQNAGVLGKHHVANWRPEERELLESLIKQAVGFDAQRGDSLTLAQSRFAPAPQAANPSWRENWQPFIVDAFKWMLIAIVLGLGIVSVRTLMTVRPQPARGENVAAAPTVPEDRIEQVRAMARQDPRKIAQAIQQWMEH